MELYDLMKNIRKTDYEQAIINTINKTKNKLTSLTEERTCFLYSSYIYEELKNNHIPARIISTKDLNYDYEHRFVLVPNTNEDNYFIIDLTFSQFNNKELFNDLLNKGYQKINNDLLSFYLPVVTNDNKDIEVSLDDIFYINENKKISR